MQTMIQHFWQRFRHDILSTMQIRTKWQTNQFKNQRFGKNQGREISGQTLANGTRRGIASR